LLNLYTAVDVEVNYYVTELKTAKISNHVNQMFISDNTVHKR